MKLRFRTNVAHLGLFFRESEVYDVPEDIAEIILEKGLAEKVEEEPEKSEETQKKRPNRK